MQVRRIDHTAASPVDAAWPAWHPDWPIARWCAIAIALVCIAIAAQACKSPIVAKSGHTRILVENPLKALLAAVAALEIRCLFSSRLQIATAKALSVSLWRVIAFIGSLQAAAMALIGIVTFDLRWKSASIWNFPPPTVTATISFLLLVIAFTRTDPRPQLISILQRFGTQWMAWNWRGRTVLIFLAINVAMITNSFCTYWKHTSTIFSYHNELLASSCDENGRAAPNFDNFCRRCREEIPSDAKILYRGPNEGLVLAYELYPRRMYLLPQDQHDMFYNCWCRETWCQNMAPDPLEHYWKWDQPCTSISPEKFIADHQITYLVTFDNTDISKNLIQALR
jgi:hypothetical protein